VDWLEDRLTEECGHDRRFVHRNVADYHKRSGAVGLVRVGVDELALLNRQIEATEVGNVHAQRDDHLAGLAVEVLEVQRELVHGLAAVDAALIGLGVSVEVELHAGACRAFQCEPGSSGISARPSAAPRYLNRGGNQQLTAGTGSCRCCTNRASAHTDAE
jgi:hypothetical protein